MSYLVFRRPAGLISISLLLAVCSVASIGAASFQPEEQKIGPVSIVPLQLTSHFEDAVAKNAFAHACAWRLSVLRNFFAERGLPFDSNLVANDELDRYCHIYYEPSLPGFRADPDDWPVSELFADVNSLGFLTLRVGQFGDSLDISRRILSEVERPLSVNLGITEGGDRKMTDDALAFHFPRTRHQVQIRGSGGTASANHWVQDYLKLGQVSGERKVLVTRRLFEADPASGARHQPLLDSYSGSQFVRSKLSWDGGDIQFALHPKEKDKLIVFCGNAAQEYWGAALTLDEYLYVLRVEFGADYGVDFGDLAAHIDYFAFFVPESNLVLVSQPMRENYELALAALEIFRQRLNHPQIEELERLESLLNGTPAEIKKHKGELEHILKAARKTSAQWLASSDPDLASRLERFADAECPENPGDCFTLSHALSLRGKDPRLMADWVAAYGNWWTDVRLADCVLAIVASQLPGFDPSNAKRFEKKVNELKRLGFQTIPVPRIGGDPKIGIPWSGISYVNALLVDKKLFVPRFGLGQPEETIFENLKAALPGSYSVVPVYARQALVHNGGVHCTVAIGRRPDVNLPPGVATD